MGMCYICDRCGKIIDRSEPTVIDPNDYATNLLDAGKLEGMEVCDECYDKFMDAQKEAIYKWLHEKE